MSAPLTFTWIGDALVPLPRFAKMAAKQFEVGQPYRMDVCEERSRITHNHYFACIQEAWKNLPEPQADRFPTAEHLRKWCLIRAGFRDERSIVAASKAEAQRIAAFIRPIDDFAVVVVSGAVVSHYTAKSQSVKAMGKDEFQASKQAVLEILAGMIGVEPTELEKAA